MRAVADQGEERKSQGKTHAALHTLVLDGLCKAKNRKSNQADERDFDKSGHHVDDGAKERTRNPDRNAFHNLLGFGHEQERKHGRHRKHGVKVSAHAEEGDIADKDQDAVAVFFVTLVVPNEAEVRNEHQDKHGDAVDFGFDSIEPERVRESEQESRHECGSRKHGRTDLTGNLFGKGIGLKDRRQQFPGKESRHIDGRRRTHHRDVVHTLCNFTHEREQHDDCTGKEHEEGRSRRMRNAKRIGASDKFATVPEADRGGHREYIHDQSHESSNACEDMFHPFFLEHLTFPWVR